MGDDVRARLGEREMDDLRKAYERDKWAGEWNSLPTAVERILTARAAAPDGLREAVEGLAAEYESDRDVCLSWIEDPSKHVDPDHPRRLSDMADLLNRSAERLRVVLAAHPAPGGGA